MVESGYDQPDGHNHHQPHVTDLFYADLDGNWTDLQSYTYRTAQNLPGDGIYDQNTIPSDIEFAVGRVTLHNMTARGKDERELMRDYVHKAFAWKHAHREVPERAIFQHDNGEHHETRAYTNAMFGGNVLDGGNIGTLSQEEPVFLGYSFSSDRVNWSPSSANHLVGYHVYRSAVKTGPYTRLTATPIAASQYSDATVPAGALYYQVRAVADMADPADRKPSQSESGHLRISQSGWNGQ